MEIEIARKLLENSPKEYNRFMYSIFYEFDRQSSTGNKDANPTATLNSIPAWASMIDIVLNDIQNLLFKKHIPDSKTLIGYKLRDMAIIIILAAQDHDFADEVYTADINSIQADLDSSVGELTCYLKASLNKIADGYFSGQDKNNSAFKTLFSNMFIAITHVSSTTNYLNFNRKGK